MVNEKSTQFRELLFSKKLELVMETYNGLSAKIVEEAGFKCVWASGLSTSASMGLRDCNESTSTQFLQVVEQIVDATTLPVLVDADTGYGDFNDARRFVRQLCKLGAVGLTIEDTKVKTSSYAGEKTPADLEDITEYCSKIRAAQDAKTDEKFTVIARIHSLICNATMDETVKRAVAYKNAGADAIFIHSKLKNADEIFNFAKIWKNDLKYTEPLVISPVSYFNVPMQEFEKNGIAMAIIAGYNIRASITAMRDISKRIISGEPLAEVEKRVVPLADIFTLVDQNELNMAEKKYKSSK